MTNPVALGVSVVIPAFQSERFIQRALASVFAQQGCTIADVIVVDDGSTDGTLALLDPLACAGRVTLLRQGHHGMAAARNRGLAAARGDLIAFLDHDERWPTDKLAWQSEVLRSTPDAVLVAGVSVLVDEADREVGTYGVGSSDVSRAELFRCNPIGGPSSTLMRTAAVRAAGGFDEAIFGADDWDLYLRLVRQGRLLRRDRIGAYNLQHAAQASRDVVRMAEASARVLRKHLGELPGADRSALIGQAGWVFHSEVRRLWQEGDRLGAVMAMLRLEAGRHLVTPTATTTAPPALTLGRVLGAARRKAWVALPATLPPSPPPSADAPTLHALVCRRHVMMAVASAKSFNLACGAAARWVHHDDGTLTSVDLAFMRLHLPGCRVISRAESNAHAVRALRSFPALHAWREKNLMSLKIVDVALWSSGERVGYVDTDILFFRRPDALLAALSETAAPSVFNRDLGDQYCDDPTIIRTALQASLLERGNAGLWAMPKQALSLEKLDHWLRHPVLADKLAIFATEQTMTVLLGSNGPGGAAHLPPDYDLSEDVINNATVCRHYAGHMRHGFADVGLPHLFRACRFRDRWLEFASTARR